MSTSHDYNSRFECDLILNPAHNLNLWYFCQGRLFLQDHPIIKYDDAHHSTIL